MFDRFTVNFPDCVVGGAARYGVSVITDGTFELTGCVVRGAGEAGILSASDKDASVTGGIVRDCKVEGNTAADVTGLDQPNMVLERTAVTDR